MTDDSCFDWAKAAFDPKRHHVGLDVHKEEGKELFRSRPAGADDGYVFLKYLGLSRSRLEELAAAGLV